MAGRGTFPLGELAILEVAGVQLQPQQEVVELRHKGPIGEDVAEGIGEPGPWDHDRGVQGVGITFGDFRKERLIFCGGRGMESRSQELGSLIAQTEPCMVAQHWWVSHCKCCSHLLS